MLAAIRPDEINLPLFVHVLGAAVLVGALLAITIVTVIARRGTADDQVGPSRFVLKTLLVGVLPAFIVMRVGAQWLEAKEDYPDDFDPSWLVVGWITADTGALLILISVVLSVIGLRKLRAGGGLRLGRIVGTLSVVLLAAYIVAVWAMTAKPG